MAIELENILNIDITQYCEMVGKSLSDYTPYGVQCTARDRNAGEMINSLIDFQESVPENAEVVVNFDISFAAASNDCFYFLYGTALIPKQKPSE
jgi:hypothetical protein